MPPRLYLSHDSDLDWLIALEFGRVDDAQPPDYWRRVTDRFGFLADAPGGRVVGFKVIEFSRFDADAADIWAEPRFDAPLLGLKNASAGEVCLAARTHFNGADSVNRLLFAAATQATGEEAVALWRQCLEAGDAMAHFALGYTLLELGRSVEAYRHLRHYTEIAPHGSWNWCWYGYAAEAVGEPAEARRAYRRAIELEEAGDQETDAAARLARMASGDDPRRPLDAAARIRGCFLGGAVGDALGAGVEFDWMEDIHRKLGPAGVTDYVEAYGRRGAITDDTQMTLFTAEGLLLAEGPADVRSVVDRAYARWLRTQGERSPRWPGEDHDGGWLAGVPALNHRRAPGRTCLSGLKAERAGSVAEPINESKGCGGVMRIAPVGLLGGGYDGDPFDLGCEIAALTHGHPSGYLAAGAMALIVARLLAGESLDAALDAAERRLAERPHHEETLGAVRAARALAASDVEPGPEAIATLGAGWVAEEALAIGTYGALVARDYTHGVLIAVNHSGDCDSTAAITGSMLGAMLGVDAIPHAWLAELEVRDEIERLAAEWVARFA